MLRDLGEAVKRTIALGAFLLVAVHADAGQHFDGKTLWRHVEVLAADSMEGRGTGTDGLERAEAYVVEQVKKAHLVPAGVNGYFQPVKLARREVLDCSAALVRDGRVEPLALGEDAACTTFVDIAPNVNAPLVFLGYGLQVPENGYDDFAGLDLKGKIAVTIPGLPEGVPGPLAADAVSKRWDLFRKAGLVGWIFMPLPTAPWTLLAASVVEPSLHLTGELDLTHDEQIMMYFNPAHAEKLFDGTGHNAAALFGLARNRRPLPHFALPVTLRVRAKLVNTKVESSNVVAKLEGSDQRLRNEYVVLSAHIDPLGIGKPVNGDAIYNGAFDNASGVAALLDIIAELKREGARPKRSVLFTFFTAEESGLLGSKYFVAHSTVNPKAIVANLNLDIIHGFVPLKALAVIGLDESDLGDAARRAAATQDIPAEAEIELHPASAFIGTSDQANFVFAGIPAVALKVGFPGESAALLQAYRQNPYHTPFDDLQQPVNLETFAKFEEVTQALLLDVANNPSRPQWKSTSFYKRYVVSRRH